MGKKTIIKSFSQLDSIVQNNSKEVLKNMIESGSLAWDKEKYDILPAEEYPNGSSIGEGLLGKNAIASKSGKHAVFQRDYAEKMADSIGLGGWINYDVLLKTDQLLSEGFEVSGSRTESFHIHKDYEDKAYTINDFQNPAGEKRQMIRSTEGPLLHMSYNQLKNRQKYLDTHQPQWVTDALQFSEETGYDKNLCKKMFLGLQRDPEQTDSLGQKSLPYEPGNRNSISKYAQDYKNDIQTLVSEIAKSENWHQKPDPKTKFAPKEYQEVLPRYNLAFEINETGKNRTREAFNNIMEGKSSVLLASGKLHYADNIEAWKNLNLSAARKEVLQQMDTIGQYRDFVNQLPERNIGHLAKTLKIEAYVVNLIGKEGTAADMKDYLTNHDQTDGRTYKCPQQVAKIFYEAVHDNPKAIYFGRSDIMPTAVAIHNCDTLNAAEKRELLSECAKAHINWEIPFSLNNDGNDLVFMAQTESLEVLKAYINDPDINKTGNYYEKRLNETIKSLNEPNMIDIKEAVADTFRSSNISPQITTCYEKDEFGNYEKPTTKFEYYGGGCYKNLELDPQAKTVVEAAEQRTTEYLKQMVAEAVERGTVCDFSKQSRYTEEIDSVTLTFTKKYDQKQISVEAEVYLNEGYTIYAASTPEQDIKLTEKCQEARAEYLIHQEYEDILPYSPNQTLEQIISGMWYTDGASVNIYPGKVDAADVKFYKEEGIRQDKLPDAWRMELKDRYQELLPDKEGQTITEIVNALEDNPFSIVNIHNPEDELIAVSYLNAKLDPDYAEVPIPEEWYQAMHEKYESILPYEKQQTMDQISEALQKDPRSIVNISDPQMQMFFQEYLSAGNTNEEREENLSQKYNDVLWKHENQTPEDILKAIQQYPVSIINVYDQKDFELAQKYLETGIIPSEWNTSQKQEATTLYDESSKEDIIKQVAEENQLDSSHLKVDDQNIVSRTILTQDGLMDIPLGRFENGTLNKEYSMETEMSVSELEENSLELETDLSEQDSFDTQDI